MCNNVWYRALRNDIEVSLTFYGYFVDFRITCPPHIPEKAGTAQATQDAAVHDSPDDDVSEETKENHNGY